MAFQSFSSYTLNTILKNKKHNFPQPFLLQTFTFTTQPHLSSSKGSGPLLHNTFHLHLPGKVDSYEVDNLVKIHQVLLENHGTSIEFA